MNWVKALVAVLLLSWGMNNIINKGGKTQL